MDHKREHRTAPLPPLARVMGVCRQQHNEISFIFTAGYVCVCGMCSHVLVLGLSVRLTWCPMLWVR